MIIHSLPLSELPFVNAHDGSLPAQVLREFKPSEPDLVLRTGVGIERDSNFSIFPRNPIEIRNWTFHV